MTKRRFIRRHPILSALVLVVVVGGLAGCASGWFAHQISSFIHDAPLGGGDSGGAVANAEGHLLGITEEVNAHRHLRVFGRDFLTHYHATAISPDPEWLRQRILKDRAQSP